VFFFFQKKQKAFVLRSMCFGLETLHRIINEIQLFKQHQIVLTVWYRRVENALKPNRWVEESWLVKLKVAEECALDDL
jgi:hypothetical protein